MVKQRKHIDNIQPLKTKNQCYNKGYSLGFDVGENAKRQLEKYGRGYMEKAYDDLGYHQGWLDGFYANSLEKDVLGD